jgi:hypothetical protein
VAAFFSRVGQEINQQAMVATLTERETGEVRIPGTPGNPGPQVEPRFITGESIDPGEGAYRRTELARIVTSKNNPYFVRATVNRVWSFFFGKGFTDPDDMSKPDFADVLKVLEDDFRAHRDMRRLAKVIVSTRTYQLTSRGPAKGKDEQIEVYARTTLRPLTAEQLWWSFEEAVGLDAALDTIAQRQGDPEVARDRRRTLRRGFFRIFGESESGPNPDYSLTQAFALLNGVLTNDLLAPRLNPVVAEILERNPDQQVDALFSRVLGRRASKGERRALRTGSGDQGQHLQDILWALLNSSEFLYNH